MLTLRIARRDLAGPWIPSSQARGTTSWRSGDSVIRALGHSSSTVLLVAARDGEHRVPDSAGLAPDQMVIDIDARASVVQIHAGPGGTAPLYLRATHDELCGGWDLTAHYDAVRPDDLHPLAAAHFLMGRRPYSRRTLLRPVLHLTERATAVWDGAGLAVRYPPPAPEFQPCSLAPGADPVGAFYRGLSGLVAELTGLTELTELTELTGQDADGRVALELSGGADSAVILAAGRPRHTYGLLVPGPGGRAQRSRRRNLVQRFGVRDTTLAAAAYPPLAAAGSRLRGPHRFGPHEEVYTEAFSALAGLMRRDGARHVLTGTGGDELFLPHRHETMPGPVDEPSAAAAQAPPYLTPATVAAYCDTAFSYDHAPRTVVPRSALSALASRAPLFLRHGLVPVSPLAHPDSVEFARALPPRWRADKRLARELLLASGCSRSSAFPRSHESFHTLFDRAMRSTARPVLARLFAQPALADLGLVAGGRLATAYRDFTELAATSRRQAADERFYEIAALELMVRDLAGQPFTLS